MTQPPFQSILHPTDFSPAGEDAFAHALRLAVAVRGVLHILHIEQDVDSVDWDKFPHARELLAQWRMLEPGASGPALAQRLGLRVEKAAIESSGAATGVCNYMDRHPCDLLVLMTHARSWPRRWLEGSVAEEAARLANAPALFLREGQKGFVDRASGAVTLKTILLPIEPSISPLPAWRKIVDFARLLEPMAQFRLLHVGDETPIFDGLLPWIDLRQGPVVETILSYAREIQADLIAMPTTGHHGLFDELIGGVTERVLRESSCPVLAIPVD